MTDEMILVPRYELLAWAEEWQYENDPGDGTDCITPFDTYLLKSPAEAHCATCGCVPGMTPAIRFDTTPAERDGVVRDHLIRMGWTPPAEAQAQGDAFCDGHCTWLDHAPGCPRYEDAPPSTTEAQPVYVGVDLEGGWIRATAPVGVAADILRIVDTAIDVCNDRDRPAMAEDLEAVRLYVEQASAALAKQPAAVDVCLHEWLIWPETDGFEQRCSRCGSHRPTPKADRDAALAAQQGGSDND